jgi:hypothetical protein
MSNTNPKADLKLEQIKNAQDRKDFAIAYFNATNNAIELLKNEKVTNEELQDKIIFWRDWFLSEHLKYRKLVTEKIGLPYVAKDTISALETVRDIEELRNKWLSLSEDERHDKEILEAYHNKAKTLTEIN